ncbi:type IV secretion system protein VirB10 [Campylobacter coli]|nr:TrbI/VirB10 family protein [Campylobacter coli]ECK7904255.1 TrbI/VirB10 family protein [Campylobacter coli]EGD5552730.1 TrbI/VirB10 family protein [Campylobacter coli]ELZ2420745.1 type IV secretion system protein VirB10 [Campylobacter coli]MBX0425434.1 type IV secretion system protein VirB10 [Campylobacter coli]
MKQIEEQNQQENEFDNHISDLNTQENSFKKLQGYAIFAVGGILLIVLIVYFIKVFSSDTQAIEETPKEETKDIGQSVKQKEFVAPIPQKTFNDIIAQETPAQVTPIIEVKPPKPRIVKGAGVTLVASGSGGSSSFSGNNNGAAFGEKPDTVFEFGQNGAGALQGNNLQSGGGEFVGEVFTPTAAKMSEFNQNLLLPKGTYIGCALKTRLVSSIKGGIACIVSNDVYSANGNTLLIEKGSTITGTFNSGQLDDGMDRLFVIWQEIRTPNNVIIPVYSGATDELGSSGVQGWVDHHYLKRFGSAILLSMIDDAMAILADRMSRGNNNNYYNYTENTRDNVSNIADTALKKMIDIKPTLYKNQGDLVGVYVNRDIDFSKVYKLVRNK